MSQYWYHKSNNLVVLQVPNEECLLALLTRAREAGVECSGFREPDFDDTVTAVAIESTGRRLVSNLPLALKKVA